MSKIVNRISAQSLGDIGETTVQLIMQKYSWTADKIQSDYGEDLDCCVFIDGAKTNYHFRCQVKSRTNHSNYVKLLKNGDFSVSIKSSLLKVWLTSFYPVFVIVYDDETGSCFWCNPVSQIIESLSCIENKTVSIKILRSNKLDINTKEEFLNAIELFYRKIFRLDKSIISCTVIPIIMPDYKLLPEKSLFDFLSSNKKHELTLEYSSDIIELLPAWISLLKKISPGFVFNSIKLKGYSIDLNEFVSCLKQIISRLNCYINLGEWFSFAISPIKTTSESSNNPWMQELTYWNSYSLIDQKLHREFEYTFTPPEGYLRQISRRARSWEHFHFVSPQKDLAIQLFGCYEMTPTMKNINKVQYKNVLGQFLAWQCEETDLDELYVIVSKYDLSIRILNDSDKNNILLLIINHMFDPFVGLYSLPNDWESFDNGNVRNILNKNNLLQNIPGREFIGKLPDYFEEAITNYNRDYETVTITELEYIPGLPLLHNKRLIQVSRFQIIDTIDLPLVEENFKRQTFNSKYSVKLVLVSDIIEQIYELSISWTPELVDNARESYDREEKNILTIFNSILPTKHNSKNTYQILHLNGEIIFEK